MEDKNLFTDIRDMFTGFKKGLRQMSGGSDYVEVAYQDNPNHIYDNLLKLAWIVLYLCASASLFFGISYHYKLFTQTGQGENVSIGLAVLLFLIAEVISVFIGVAFFRSILTGGLIKSIYHFGLSIMIGYIIYIAFDFRMGISAKAYAGQQAAKQKTELAEKGVKTASSNLVSKYDDEIKEARSTIAKGKKQKWNGVLTTNGERIVSEGNKTLQKYLDLQSKEFDSKTKADSVLHNEVGGLIFANQKQLNGYGGLVEWCVLILTFIIALLEKVSYLENKKDQSDETDSNQNGNNGKVEVKAFENTPQNRMGFNQSNNISKIESRKPITFKDYNDIPKTLPIEKKTLVEPNSELFLLEKGKEALNLLIKLSADSDEIDLLNNGLKSLDLLIKLL